MHACLKKYAQILLKKLRAYLCDFDYENFIWVMLVYTDEQKILGFQIVSRQNFSIIQMIFCLKISNRNRIYCTYTIP